MILKIQMSPFDPDTIHYTYRAIWLSMEYGEMGFTYSYLRYIAAAETGLLPRIDNDIDQDYDFEENYVDAIRYLNLLTSLFF